MHHSMGPSFPVEPMEGNPGCPESVASPGRGVQSHALFQKSYPLSINHGSCHVCMSLKQRGGEGSLNNT